MNKNTDAKSTSSSSYSYSFTLPKPPVADIQSVIIACCENGVLPKQPELDKLWPPAYLTVPGGVIAGGTLQVPPQPLHFLESLLASAKQIEHVIVCLHTGCGYLTAGTDLCRDSLSKPNGDSPKVLRADSADVLCLRPDHIDEPRLEPLQDLLKEQLDFLEEMIHASVFLAKRKVSLHGWLYEPELDWLSFLDTEQGLFLPLSANEKLCC